MSKSRTGFRRLPAPLMAVLGLVLLNPPAGAHHDVDTEITRFTERIESGERTAELFYRRATKYRILHKSIEAEADLRCALECAPSFTPAHRELARLLAAQGKPAAAMVAARDAIDGSVTDSERAAGLILLARLQSQNKQARSALRSCEDAFLLRPSGEVDWYLLHAELLGTLGRPAEGATILRTGHVATHSIVLRNAWIDALLDTGRLDTVFPIIERELATSRLKSSWFLRRARAHLLAKRRSAAENDLHACLLELGPRIHPSHPDLTLIADRGLANALLGRLDAARADLLHAQTAGVDPWITAPLERVLAAKTAGHQ